MTAITAITAAAIAAQTAMTAGLTPFSLSDVTSVPVDGMLPAGFSADSCLPEVPGLPVSGELVSGSLVGGSVVTVPEVSGGI